MTGAQMAGTAVISFVVVFFVAEYAMANFMATLIMTPPSQFFPTPEQIKERKTYEISAEHEIYAAADFDAYEGWEAERFLCESKAPYGTFGIKEATDVAALVEWVKNSQIPICVVHGDRDKAVSVKCAKELQAVLKNPESRVEIYEGRDHAYSICDKERYVQMLRDFLKEL